jgi:hypothetical protein
VATESIGLGPEMFCRLSLRSAGNNFEFLAIRKVKKAPNSIEK